MMVMVISQTKITMVIIMIIIIIIMIIIYVKGEVAIVSCHPSI